MTECRVWHRPAADMDAIKKEWVVAGGTPAILLGSLRLAQLSQTVLQLRAEV